MTVESWEQLEKVEKTRRKARSNKGQNPTGGSSKKENSPPNLSTGKSLVTLKNSVLGLGI